MTDEQVYKNYFSALATSHVDIDKFIFGDEEDIARVQRAGNESTGIILWLDYPQPIRGVAEHDNGLGRLTADFVVMQPASDKLDTTGQQQLKNKACQDIAQQIFAKIMNDYQSELIPGSAEPDWPSIQFGRMQEHHFNGSTYQGIAAQIDFIVDVATELDDTKWI